MKTKTDLKLKKLVAHLDHKFVNLMAKLSQRLTKEKTGLRLYTEKTERGLIVKLQGISPEFATLRCFIIDESRKYLMERKRLQPSNRLKS